MKSIRYKVANVSAQTLVLGLVSLGISSTVQASSLTGDQIVVANRGSGSLSIINPETNNLTTIDIPFNSLLGESLPEPMYVFQVRSTNEVEVGDRANNQIIFFDQTSYEITGKVDVGQGVFHMWGAADDSQLWINNEIDNTISVVDPVKKTLLTTWYFFHISSSHRS